MATASTALLVDALRQYRLLEPLQLEESKNLQGPFSDPKAFAGELIKRGWLTPYQANQLLQGRGQELVLGSYILLERLGEGGMGQVFKARHRNLGRTVAVKLIRKERLDNPSAIKRFQREVRAAAALAHPNIVHAYDADEIAGTHLLVMECVEGATDLNRLVKKDGPLPVKLACETIRQSALGLQHAYERGMVHRDIKPHNLLLTAEGKTVKVLDMGLARLDQPTEDDHSSTMTQEGAVMGTPDYIAPEQALDSHTVDIRADLYSLGCTFYYLLTGRVPFPGGTFIQKINKHQFEEPTPVDVVRPSVPVGVASVVRKLMAKKPTDRYQTPAEVAAALEAVVSKGLAASGNDRTIVDRRRIDAEPRGDTLNSAFAFSATSDTTPVGDSPHRLGQIVAGKRKLLFSVVGSAFLLVGLAVILILAFKKTGGKKLPEDHPIVATPSKKTPANGDDAWFKNVAAMPAEKQVEAVAKKLQELNPDFDSKVTHKIENGVVTELGFVTDNVTDISPVRALKGLNFLISSGSFQGKGRLSDLSPLKDMPLKMLNCNFNMELANLSPLKDMKLTVLSCGGTPVADLSPLKDMKLTELSFWNTQVSDLAPLKGMPLTSLQFQGTPVSDLSPLKDMMLTGLNCGGTKVSDLSPLKDMKLTGLECSSTPVSDLSPLKGMPLATLGCNATTITDLSSLKGMPLHYLNCDFKPFRDTDILRSIKTLETINSKPAQEFWKGVEAQQAAFAMWCKEVAALPAEKQVEAVAAKLNEINLGFDGKVTHKVENGVVTELGFVTDNVTDISPVRALKGLRALNCGANPGKGRLSDLSPLKDMKLTLLNCGNTQVADLSPLKEMKLTTLHCPSTQISDLSPLRSMSLTELNCAATKVSDLSPLRSMPLTDLNCGLTKVSDLSPLKGMPLTMLVCHYTEVTDLSPLKGMRLTLLQCTGTKVSDLSPLKGMPLTFLQCHVTPVADLAPLRGMPLTTLACNVTKVQDLSPLKGMPLQWLHCDFKPFRDTDILRSIKPLETINDKSAKDFWKEVEAKQTAFEAWCKQVATVPAEKQVEAVAAKLKELNPGFDGKLTPNVANGVVRGLGISDGNLADISPVKALTGLITFFYSEDSLKPAKLSDLSPLSGLKLTNLTIGGATELTDLNPLKGMPLSALNIGGTRVTDLSPLQGLPLTAFYCHGTPVADLTPLSAMNLTGLDCYATNVSDLSPLKAMKLTYLKCHSTKVTNLSPLKGMPLTYLACHQTKVHDLSPLKELPLKELHCDFVFTRDAKILRSIRTLERINGKEAKEFWREMETKEKKP